MKKLLLIVALCGLAAGAAYAEKADSAKPILVEADSLSGDDVSQLRTLTGNVILTRGTLIMKAGKATMRTDPEGYDHLVFIAAPGTVATFRQKQDGGDLWVEGHAERIEYDNKSDVVKLFSKSRLARLEGTRVTEEVEGAFISYDSRKESYAVENTSTGESRPGAGRVRMVIQPSPKSAPAAPGK